MPFVKILFSENFRLPVLILSGILVYLLLIATGFKQTGIFIILATIIAGSFQLFKETLLGLTKKQFGLDYIAIVAILVSVFTGQFLVAGILALMITSGRTLDAYAGSQAKKSLTALIDRIPDEVLIWENDSAGEKIKISTAKIGQQIMVRKGEVIPLDGILISESGITDESSLTGEPYLIEKISGDQIRSGTLNLGNPIIVEITKIAGDSTYNKIVELVKQAQNERSPMVRLADKYSSFFTIVTFSIAAIAYVISGLDLNRVLSVLAIATPCPLLIATPIALIGGVSAAAKRKIIIKKLSAIETLSRADTIVFDKTGTLTIGAPVITKIQNFSKKYSEKEIISIADALERNSLHPLAKAVVALAKKIKAPLLKAKNIEETVGSGISGIINKERFTLSKVKESEGMTIEMTQGNKKIALFKFEDQLKTDSKNIIEQLQNSGLSIHIFTGDKKEAAEKIASQLGVSVQVRSEMSPKDKQDGIADFQKEGKVVAMIGDGINDAPALALADAGLVFSHEEQTASSEAADIVFLGGSLADVGESFRISKRTINIALQSIFVGIGASIVGMVFASIGLIPPIYGAGLQEAIDVAVILNALRASI